MAKEWPKTTPREIKCDGKYEKTAQRSDGKWVHSTMIQLKLLFLLLKMFHSPRPVGHGNGPLSCIQNISTVIFDQTHDHIM